MEETVELPNSDHVEMVHQHIPPKRKKGGLVTMPFVIVNEAFERVASFGLVPNMIFYLMRDYNLGFAKGNNLIFYWSAATQFMPILGAFLSDSYLGRFLTIVSGSIASFLGIVLLWLTAMIPWLRPPPCDQSKHSCKSATTIQMAVLMSSFALISTGAGGIRPCSLAFGADQLDRGDNPKNNRVLKSFFGLYYASQSISVFVALTAVVYVQDHLGWKVGFGVPAILMFFSAFFFFLASPLYVKRKAKKSLFTGFAQVLIVSYKNRKLPFPDRSSGGLYHHGKNLLLVSPTEKLRLLNKACIIRDPEVDINQDGSASNPWSLCTTEQVEELKALIKVIPLWSTGIIVSISVSQSTFPILQANSMDRHITSSFQIPAASFGLFAVIVITIWVALYERVTLPLASKIIGKPVRPGPVKRMGIGTFLSCMAMVISAVVEHIRLRKAIREGHANDAHAVLDMSALWLVPQYCLIGLAEAFNALGQIEFYYSEFPKSMSSIATSLFGLGMAVASLLASLILSTVDDLSSRGGKESWVSNNINKGHYDYYYWLLAVVMFLNLPYFIVCSWAYGPLVENGSKRAGEGSSPKLPA
ncbi:protein NRT1/ PTR FAMILY 1.2-like [Juglans microcarpa x Juglans regia]|uniref:protein NRT1/ PTR FAMILY 1.2-like n=1 Tax=Juglans microcarpa x Juglans regia TaxID=2249226 RepID=UPI001B7F616B|nr:protein NRT1/ PTR FAMILY 1.2-like [Juglans microcarpa x Juglans regia]